MAKVTIKDVAVESGVSTATVSRVINNSGFVSEPIKERVMAVIQRLNYQPNAIAKSLKQDKTKTIGVVVPDISNAFFMSISKGIEDSVHEEGYNLFICSGDENPQKEAQLLQLLYEKRVDAIVLATSGKNEETVARIQQSGLPVILIDRKIDKENHPFDMVVEDNVQGAYQLTKQLIQQGHRRIGVINGCLDVSTGSDRFNGYAKAMNEFALPVNADLVYNGLFSQNGGVQAARYFMSLPERPTAILSFNNHMTFGVLLELTRRGVRIPEDVTIASYGEVDAALLLKQPGFIFVSQSPYEMGTKAGNILLERLVHKKEGPFQEIFEPVIKRI